MINKENMDHEYESWLIIVQNKTPEELEKLEQIITFWRRQSNKITGKFNMNLYAKIITNGSRQKH